MVNDDKIAQVIAEALPKIVPQLRCQVVDGEPVCKIDDATAQELVERVKEKLLEGMKQAEE